MNQFNPMFLQYLFLKDSTAEHPGFEDFYPFFEPIFGSRTFTPACKKTSGGATASEGLERRISYALKHGSLFVILFFLFYQPLICCPDINPFR